MPPKRKTADPDEERSLLAKVARKTDSKIGEESTKKSKGESEIIKYDEYMEGGIPDALLEGLGFTESEGLEEAEVVEEEEEERQEEILPPMLPIEKSFSRHAAATTQPGFQEAMSAFVASQIATMTQGGESSSKLSAQHYLEMAMAAVGKANATSSQGSASALLGSLSKAATQSPALDLSSQKSSANVRSSRRISAAREQQTSSSHVSLIPKSSLRPALSSPSPRASPNVAVQAPNARPQMSLMSPAVQQARAAQSRPMRSPIVVAPRNVTPRTVTKGNIVYERMPTGEVIASLIKKPEGSVNKPQTPAVIDPSPRRPVSTYKPPNQQTTMMSPVNMDDCPINEFNVGDVLEHSIKATQSMRMLLTSLRDDLRRVGAGAAMVTDEQLRKRQEVAEKLAKAYAAYKQSIEDVERPRAIAPAVADAARPVMLVKHTSAGRSEPRGQQRSNHGQKGQNEVIDVSDSDDETRNSLNTSSSRNSEGSKIQRRWEIENTKGKSGPFWGE